MKKYFHLFCLEINWAECSTLLFYSLATYYYFSIPTTCVFAYSYSSFMSYCSTLTNKRMELWTY